LRYEDASHHTQPYRDDAQLNNNKWKIDVNYSMINSNMDDDTTSISERRAGTVAKWRGIKSDKKAERKGGKKRTDKKQGDGGKMKNGGRMKDGGKQKKGGKNKKEKPKRILYWNDFYGSRNFGFCCGSRPYKVNGCRSTNCQVIRVEVCYFLL
jgi:hypothetical protein